MNEWSPQPNTVSEEEERRHVLGQGHDSSIGRPETLFHVKSSPTLFWGVLWWLSYSVAVPWVCGIRGCPYNACDSSQTRGRAMKGLSLCVCVCVCVSQFIVWTEFRSVPRDLTLLSRRGHRSTTQQTRATSSLTPTPERLKTDENTMRNPLSVSTEDLESYFEAVCSLSDCNERIWFFIQMGNLITISIWRL